MTAVTTPSSSASPTPRQVWIRIRGLLLAVLVLVAAGVALAATHSGDRHGHLDPRSADRYGSGAVAELLKDRGVSVRVVTTLQDATSTVGPDTTLLVAAPNLLTPGQQNTSARQPPTPSADSSAASGGGGDDGDAGDDSAGGESSFIDLIPSGWLWGTLQLALSAVLAAVWRARRLGPVIA